MRVVLASLTAATIVLSSVGAFAAGTMTSGVVKSFDARQSTLTLNDGTAYSMPKGFKDPGLKTGNKVELSWHMQGGKHAADTVKIIN
jgi:Cu/Ag efflux protein CusF